MDLIEKMVLPQSEQHILLLKYMLVLAFMIFIPYFALVYGSLLNSLLIKSKQSEKSNLSYDIIKLLTFNKYAPIGFGIVPFLSIIFIYQQLLHQSGAAFTGISFLLLILLIAGTTLIYFYKHYYALQILFGNDNKLINAENTVAESFRANVNNYKKYGKIAFVLLSLALYLFEGLVNYISNSINWVNGFLSSLNQLNTVINFIVFVIVSLLLSNSIMLWNFFRNNDEATSPEFALKINKLNLSLTLILPSLMLVNVVFTSVKSLSYDYFIYALASVAILLLIAISLFSSIKHNKIGNSNLTILLLLIFIFFNIIREQYSFSVNIQLHENILAQNYIDYQNKINAELGLNEVKISGEDIFNGKCIACHNFDKKIVGPPYKDVLPKYEGKMSNLVKFVLNPVKVNPDYPSMPNQGLKPLEAEAIAEYIMKTYTEKYK